MKKFLLCGFALLLPSQLWGDEVKERIAAKLSKHVPGITADSVRESPMPGIYEVAAGTQIIYVSADGAYAILGDMIDLERQRNVSETRRAEAIKGYLARFEKNEMLVIAPEDPKRFLTVFTDVDCPYCAQFHLDVPKLNEAGIEVRYLMFPRTGIGTRSYDRAVSVWCADDRIEAIGVAKAGGEVGARECTNPVTDHFNLGQEIGIRGTPTIILDDGRTLPGYVPAAKLIAQLGLEGSSAQ
ncbi:MAG: DsbC family protein [Gammaproteobacteria bacterium]|nr:DsbC family protein [Gammaproteobacteria bacterium]